MREMKDSGVRWLGMIPKSWDLDKIVSLYSERSTKVSDKDYPALSVTKQGIVPQLESAAKTDNGDNRKLIKKNDFVINSRSDRRGSCGISEYEGSCSLINIVLAPKNNMVNQYYNYLFKTELFADEFYKWGNGIVDDLWSTKWNNMKNIVVPFPSLEEQQVIAEHLDTKCAQIDTIIANEQSIIEKLHEYKRSVITEVIIKGLNPAISMKYSGLGWLGDIPITWDMRSLKRVLITPITDGPHETPTLYDEGIPFVSAESVKGGIINLDYKRGYISLEDHERFQKKVSPKRGDIFIVKSGATTGNIGLVITDQIFDIWSPLALVRGDSSAVEQEFLYYQLFSNIFRVQVEQGWSYGTQQNIGMKALGNIKVIVPPLDEQRTIVKYLHKKCANIDSTILKKQSIIEKLNEYKKSLIYEVVTGKKEVPHV